MSYDWRKKRKKSVIVCVWQVQNISQSMEVLDLRTFRDLQYVRNTESLMKVVDGKLKVASENPRSLNPKGFQVIDRVSSLVRNNCQEKADTVDVKLHAKRWQMQCNLYCFSPAIKFCITLDRLPHKHWYTNSIPVPYLRYWVIHRGRLI